jgi:Putative restriction endonuclease
MNRPFTPPHLSRLTQAAEGLPRWRWTVAEVEAMARAGIFAEDERFELIGGEIVPMNPKGIHHGVLKLALNNHFVKNTPEEFRVIPETTFHMSEDTFVDPDFIFFRKADGLANLNPRTAHRASRGLDRRLEPFLAPGPQGEALCQFRHPGIMGNRGGAAFGSCS